MAQEAFAERDNHDNRNGCRVEPCRVVVTSQSPALDHMVEVGAMPLMLPLAQPLPNGRVLLVSRVCDWRPFGPDKNAIVYSADGSPTAEGTLGDGIEHLRTTPAGYIWVGYADTGIFGNNGWGHRGAKPVGWSGVVGFSDSLQVDWRYPVDELGPIDDCEAMTVTGESLWVWCYGDYQLALVEDRGANARIWENPVRGSLHGVAAYGAKALLTDGDQVALVGGYTRRKAHDRVLTARLQDELVAERKLRLVMPDGTRLPEHAQMAGHGCDLNVFVAGQWLRIGLEDLV
jgi:hypothetical protein